MGKRQYGSGSLVEKPPGSGQWTLRLTVGTDLVTGKRRRKDFRFTAKGAKAAEREADKIRVSVWEEKPTGTSATLEVLLKEWLRHIEARGRAATTIRENRRTAKTLIIPALGDTRIGDLAVRQIDAFYTDLLTRDRPLAASSVRRVHAVLRAALNQGVKWGWISQNPANLATLPTVEQARIVLPSPEDVRALAEAMREKGEVYGMATVLAIVTGARRGELCALRWCDLEDDMLLISRSIYKAGDEFGVKATKSGRERVVVLQPAMLKRLERWRRERDHVADAAGVVIYDDSFILSSWPDHSQPMNPDTITGTFRRCAVALGIPEIHLHSLRHHAATEMLAAGVSPRDAADVLGHASPSMTLNVYSHATVERQRAASRVLGRALDNSE